MIVAAFVGYQPNFDSPFAVDTNHGSALMHLSGQKALYNFKDNRNGPKFYGFVDKDSSGNYKYVDRKEAYAIAKENNQLNDRKGLPNHLDSYQIKEYNSLEILALSNLSHDVIKKFEGKEIELKVEPPKPLKPSDVYGENK